MAICISNLPFVFPKERNLSLCRIECWRFFSKDGLIGVETGLYFGDKNKYIENQNIFISGITQNNEQLIEWQISKI